MRDVEYLKLMSREYPSIRSASGEMINLMAIQGLPKGTEYFFSDLHGEHEAFIHLLRSSSGIIREKIKATFGYIIPEEEQIVYNGEFTEESGQELTRQALKEHPEATAVLYAYNVQARGGVDYLAQAGIQVGKELSVLVIGAPDWVHTGNNRFTCVDLNGRGLGTIAAETLFDIIDHEGAVAPYQKDQISTLLEGDSVCRVQSV